MLAEHRHRTSDNTNKFVKGMMNVRERGLGRKKKSTNDDWFKIYDNIEKIVPKSHIDRLVDRTVRQIQRITRGKISALCWSGGKDSVLVQKLCEMAGTVNRGVWVTAKQLEFPAFYDWCIENKPEYVEIHERGFDYEWLKENPKMFFPDPNDPDVSKIKTKWDDIFQRKGQNIYFKENPEIEIMVTGRRKADGNFCGNKTNYYQRSDGQIRFNPVADWKHEEMLAFFKYYDVQLPPIYTRDGGFPQGWVIGTILWANLLLRGNEKNTWRYIYDIDKSIVINASRHFKYAKILLDEMEGNDK